MPMKPMSGFIQYKDMEHSVMSFSQQQRLGIAHHGLYLVPRSPGRAETPSARSGMVYRIAAVAAALFLAMTVC